MQVLACRCTSARTREQQFLYHAFISAEDRPRPYQPAASSRQEPQYRHASGSNSEQRRAVLFQLTRLAQITLHHATAARAFQRPRRQRGGGGVGAFLDAASPAPFRSARKPSRRVCPRGRRTGRRLPCPMSMPRIRHRKPPPHTTLHTMTPSSAGVRLRLRPAIPQLAVQRAAADAQL
jgi:hypothetical protein